MIRSENPALHRTVDFALQIPFRRADGTVGRRSVTPTRGSFGRSRLHATHVDSSSMPAGNRTAFRE